MLLYDDDILDNDRQRHEYVRKVRRTFEVCMTTAILFVTAVQGSLFRNHIVGIYVYLGTVYMWGEMVRRGLRWFGNANHMAEATEIAKCAPFCAVAAYALAWLGTSELILGTNVLREPFSRHTAYTVTSMLMTIAFVVTWKGSSSPFVRAHMDKIFAGVWVVLCFPTSTAAPRVAPGWSSVFRLLVLFIVHFSLSVRDESRLSPGRGQTMTTTASVHVTTIAAHMSAFRVAQTAWITHCTPIVLLVAAIALIPASYLHHPARTIVHATSPDPSPRSTTPDAELPISEHVPLPLASTATDQMHDVAF